MVDGFAPDGAVYGENSAGKLSGSAVVNGLVHNVSSYYYQPRNHDLLRDYFFLRLLSREKKASRCMKSALPFGKAFHAEKNTAGVMFTNTKSQPAASPKKAGYSQNKSTPGLALAWLDYCQDPGSASAADHLANHLDGLFKRRVPDGHYTGILKGRDEDVRQEAYLLLIRNYLAGNPDLVVATASEDQRAITEEIQKSLAGSVRAVSKTLKKRLLRHQKIHVYGEDLDTHDNNSCIHPACRKNIWELPFDLQRQIVFASLRIAIRDKLILARSARVAMDMIDSGFSQSEVARSHGVSRQAVHAILAPVRKHLAEVVAAQEFPLA